MPAITLCNDHRGTIVVLFHLINPDTRQPYNIRVNAATTASQGCACSRLQPGDLVTVEISAEGQFQTRPGHTDDPELMRQMWCARREFLPRLFAAEK